MEKHGSAAPGGDAGQAREIIRDGLRIAIGPDFRTGAMAHAKELAGYFGLDAKAEAGWMAQASRLCGIAESIIQDYPETDVFGFLPLTKAGKFPKGQSILLADSGISVRAGAHDPVRRLQLRLVPAYADVQDFIHGMKLEDVLILRLDVFDGQTLTAPVFGADGRPRKTGRSRNRYLKDADIVPGAVYADAKGTEYLYLGDLLIQCVRLYDGVPGFDDLMYIYQEELGLPAGPWESVQDVPLPPDDKLADMDSSHCYLRMTRKYEAMAAGCGSLDEFVTLLVSRFSKGHAMWTEKLSMREHPRKFVSQARALFQDNKISAAWRAGQTGYDDPGGSAVDSRWRVVALPGCRKEA